MYNECMLAEAWMGKTVLLPLVNQDKIREVICEMDDVFLSSVVKRPGFDGLVDKIANKAVVMAACLDGRAVGMVVTRFAIMATARGRGKLRWGFDFEPEGGVDTCYMRRYL